MPENVSSKFHIAQDHANYGRNDEFLAVCDEIYKHHSNSFEVLSHLGSLYLAYGFPSKARNCFDELVKSNPNNPNLLVNLAHSELLLGNVENCQIIFDQLLQDHPSNLDVLQQIIFFRDYFLNISNEERLSLARKWGELAIQKANGPHVRPHRTSSSNGKIRIGYVSGDFCQHTVGLLIKNVIASHDKSQFEIYAFSSGSVVDWVTQEIKTHSNFLDIRSLSDQEFSDLIKQCGIDILVDLSGHTGRSCLSVFAHRPAPIQLSWLGYYASTGLEYIDGIILDRWHITKNTENFFVERIIEMPQGRWCYMPAFPAPLPVPPPVLKNGYTTFGSFNNTLKYNPVVFDCWSRILKLVPRSKLVLKWRTFNDPEYFRFVLNQFALLGIDSSRIELRGPSFHMKMLEEYRDIDIALDPFPFSGGMTSCEALYMGVPVITMPLDQVVSRQTSAFLHAINRPDWIAETIESYIRIAIDLASNQDQLVFERNSLRDAMLESSLMQINTLTNSLEYIFINQINNR